MSYLKTLFTVFFLLIALAVVSQQQGSQLELRLMKKNSAKKTGSDQELSPFAGVVEEGDKAYIYIINKGNKPLYFNLMELQPQNEINFFFPSSYRYAFECVVKPKDTLLIGMLEFTPPYGVNKLILLEKDSPFDLQPAFKRTTTRGSELSNTDEAKAELIALVMGRPSWLLRDIAFSFFDYYIIPKQGATTAGIFSKQYYPSRGGLQSFVQPSQLFLTDDCITKIEDLKNLYVKYPIVSLLQPLKAGGSGLNRGSEPEYETAVAGYTLKGTAMAQNGIKTVLINGQEAWLTKFNDYQFSWEKEMRLQPGINEFKVTAFTSAGISNCETVRIHYQPQTNTTKLLGENYLFVVGINNYSSWNPLNGAVNDAKQFRQLMTESFHFTPSNTYELYNEAATFEKIDSVFMLLIDKLTPQDNLVVYFAGHGIMDKKLLRTGYWIPADARLNKTTDYIPNSRIKDYLEALKCKHAIVFADCCYSGGFFKTRGENNAEESRVESLRSRWMFCSGREEEVADQMAGKENSPFAYFLFQTLTSAGEAGISITDLYQRVKTSVANNSKQTPVAGPVMETGDEGGMFIFRKKK